MKKILLVICVAFFGNIGLAQTYSAPIGSIVSSMLAYDEFMSVNGFEMYDNNQKLQWVPCDGRNIVGSKYASSDRRTAPDLRGVFLRNTNDYGVVGAAKVNRDHLNPENVQVGDFQSDDFESHQHGFGGNFLNNAGTLIWNLYGTTSSHKWQAKSNNSGVKQSTIMSLTSPVGGAETRPKNITVYYYLRIN